MADITFAMGRDSSHSAAKKELDVRNNTKYTNRNQLAIAAVLFLGGIVGVIVLALYLMAQEGVFLY
ncbi:hypothetical protein [Citrobacter freundii]|uniref:hypothetical protein n=1 Tax=Citrobacter freundii TaxID=546 RepID=UPI001BD0F88D|nr:hypothetical protein [Citrobacter freundii]